jgi:hypothetical protein
MAQLTSGNTTPEYNTVLKSARDITSSIIRDDFFSAAYSCGLIPTSTPSPSSPPLDVVLAEISRDPVNYYSLQHVLAALNEGGRFDKSIGKMEKIFQCKEINDDVTWGVDAISLHAYSGNTEEMYSCRFI